LISSGQVDEARDSHLAQRERAAQKLIEAVQEAGLTVL
jgi:hypothetical protein